ncbi:MAG: L,D-transpeptidase [Lachnospiraceae bacterium]|nr:L,D-transpeptidase [Lachnospiraceae bacterium]
MKRVFLTITTVLFVALAFFVPSVSAQAQNIASVTYDFSSYPIPSGKDSAFVLDQNGMMGLLQKNADGSYFQDAAGNYSADINAVTGFVSSLASMYEISGCTVMNQVAESQYLISAISQGIGGVRIPQITVSTVPEAQAAIETASAAEQMQTVSNMTYIDIDIDNQKLTYFVNGAPVLISDVVTGNARAHHDTPKGTYTLYGKSTNRTLKGADYEAFVKYWMPFTGNYGIHDASWRKSFGGSIYQTSGSHGCVNLPGSMAEALFNQVSVGTMVVIH